MRKRRRGTAYSVGTVCRCYVRRKMSSATVRTVMIAAAVAVAVAGPWTTADGARILAVESIAGKSHWNFMRAVLRALTDRGHAVTVFTPFADGDRANYTEVDMSTVFPIKLDMDLSLIIEQFTSVTSLVPLSVTMSRQLCDIVYANDRMKGILRDGSAAGFDVVMVEPLGSTCISYVAAKLGLPMIYVIPSPMITHHERAFLGHAPNPAAVSHLLADHAVPRSFVQRFANVALFAYSAFSVAYTEWSEKRADPKPYDLVPTVRPAAVIVNSHHITESTRPTLPNVVEVGGLHLERPDGTLRHDILEFIENSPNGVIYFTFGSVVKMSTLPDNIKNAFKEALSRMPQRVLWKYEGEMKDVPKNVMIKKWFPQREILLHPNVKLFISHGGISGVYETVDAGVPVLGFPLFYDQHKNIANLVDAGMAISMDLLSVSTDTLLSSMSELVNNKNYSINAKITRERFKDRPMSPEQSVVYWTEYVHRHKGAPHLKSHALNLSWYQYFLLDVFVAISVCICIALFVGYNIVKVIYKYTFVRSKNVKIKSE